MHCPYGAPSRTKAFERAFIDEQNLIGIKAAGITVSAGIISSPALLQLVFPGACYDPIRNAAVGEYIVDSRIRALWIMAESRYIRQHPCVGTVDDHEFIEIR